MNNSLSLESDQSAIVSDTSYNNNDLLRGKPLHFGLLGWCWILLHCIGLCQHDLSAIDLSVISSD